MTKITDTREFIVNGLWITIDTFDTGKKSIAVQKKDGEILVSGITPYDAEQLADTLLEVIVDKNI